MHLADRRVLRFASAGALSLALAYGCAFPLPFLAPLFVAFIALAPGPPLGFRGLLALLLVALLALPIGVLLIPVLRYYPLTAILLVALGVYFSLCLTLIAGKRLPGTFLTVGVTLISVAGTVDTLLATTVITALLFAIPTAVVSLWVVYPLFPEDESQSTAESGVPPAAAEPPSSWLALRATLIVMPAYLLALTNPSQYLMTIMKAVSLGQQSGLVDVRHAGRELLGSTFAGGVMAVAFWKLLSIAPNLWMFTLWMFAFALYTGAKLFRVLPTRLAPSFWVNALVTMLILLGPAVEDSASGKDAASAFAVRFMTFIGVTIYAWAAMYVLERWRVRRERRRRPAQGLA